MRRRRHVQGERDFNSTLPVWIIAKGERKGTLNVECPRCGGKMIVSQPRLAQEEFMGRPCIYCFRANRLPEKYMNPNVLKFLELAKPFDERRRKRR